VISLLLGIYGAHQNWSEKQVKWAEGYDCSYWDAQRNSYQNLMDNMIGDVINGLEFRYEVWQDYKSKRNDAADIFNENCLPPSAYFGK
jgi:hypothetical protein